MVAGSAACGGIGLDDDDVVDAADWDSKVGIEHDLNVERCWVDAVDGWLQAKRLIAASCEVYEAVEVCTSIPVGRDCVGWCLWHLDLWRPNGHVVEVEY